VGEARIVLLATVDTTVLSTEQHLSMVELWEESARWIAAQQQVSLAALQSTPLHGDERWSAWEVAAALRICEGTAAERLWTATMLVGRLPATLAALRAGQVTYWQAHLLAESVAGLSVADTAVVEAQVLARAPELTGAETRRLIDKAVMAVDPAAAERRHEQRRAERRVERPRPVGDGMAGTWIEGPIVDQVGAFNALTARGRAMKKAGLVETVGQGRYDSWLALMTGAAAGPQPDPGELPVPGPVPVRVGLLVNASTTAGADDQPGELVGFGPVPASVARRLAAGLPPEPIRNHRSRPTTPAAASSSNDPTIDTEPTGAEPTGPEPTGPEPTGPEPTVGGERTVRWELLPIDPATGWLARPDDPDLDRDRTTRFATDKQRRYINARDRVCFHPGCNQPAEHNDVDHRADWATDGRTNVDEMGSGCAHHNRVAKTNGWTTIVGPDGTATLTSPLGRRYPITPYRYWDP
jgi:hypothetical protein